MITLDGSYEEGGGAILRTALGFSVLLQKPFMINNIRANRPKPGLSWQHLTALNAAHQLCDAVITGNKVGSTAVTFSPSQMKKKSLKIDVGTAGSVTLVLQALLLPLVLGKKSCKVEVSGGTDVKWSIPSDYFLRVLLPQLRKFAHVGFSIKKRGFYPKGGGTVLFTAKPIEGPKKAIDLIGQSELFKIGGVSFASKVLEEKNVGLRQAEAARLVCNQLKVPVDIQVSYVTSLNVGSGITLWALKGGKEGLDIHNPLIIGSDALGDRGVKAEKVGQVAALKLVELLNGQVCCDEYLADQLIPFMAIVGGSLRTSNISKHTKSNIYVAQKFTKTKFSIKDNVIKAAIV